jgi:hypothetical protein
MALSVAPVGAARPDRLRLVTFVTLMHQTRPLLAETSKWPAIL